MSIGKKEVIERKRMNIQEKRIVDGTRSWRNREEAIKSKIECFFLFLILFNFS